jgi:anti-sigma factor RsiW
LKKCEDIRERLTLYLDNELQGAERATVEAHLSECESCAAILARELNFLNAIRECGPLHTASPALLEKVEAILNERQVSPAPLAAKPRPLASRWIVAIAAGLLHQPP